ncbi:MAG: tRNA (adenosine(37)-N6)-threonylcarbamoyltransferase complex dimerization subunit type 1 TsaB [Proteobacteria bacterium]|nr:tRNA (adenosine(37)-N6)-threonylcarbamoyltransferase complex dimerization subunit type 1 TsaB [Pseudomonadota bacterium]
MPSEPTILAFDTSAAHCAAALLHAGRVLTRVDDMGRGQAEHLMPMLEEMLAGAGLGWRDLDGIGVGVGPGNFTGIRISVAAARGLALGLTRPASGVSLFETTQALSGQARVAVPAPRGQVYLCDAGAAPVLAGAEDVEAALSSDHPPADHVACIARIAAARLASGQGITPPAPLYVRPADAAPSRDAPPVMLD